MIINHVANQLDESIPHERITKPLGQSVKANFRQVDRYVGRDTYLPLYLPDQPSYLLIHLPTYLAAASDAAAGKTSGEIEGREK